MQINANGVPVYRAIEADLLKQIQAGVLAVGARLTEKQLAQTYKVSRVTLRKALALLADAGFLGMVPGRGTFVTGPDVRPDAGPMRPGLKRLRRGVGVLVPTVAFAFYAGILRGIEDYLQAHGYFVLLGNCDHDPRKEQSYMEKFLAQGVAGLIVAAGHNSRANPAWRMPMLAGVPVVLVDTLVPGVAADFVGCDNFQGARQSVAALLAHGCRRIAFLSGHLKGVSTTAERLRGFRQAHADRKIPVVRKLIRHGDFTEAFGRESARALLSAGTVDAIFSANEPVMSGVLKAIRELGVRGPGQVRLAAFDAPVAPCDLLAPMTVVEQPRHAMGETAAQLLVARVEAARRRTPPAPCKTVHLDPELKELFSRLAPRK